MIRALHLGKHYGKIIAVHDLSFEVRPGEILGFLGPNGAGKSTTLRILSGFHPPTSGQASIAGLDLLQDSLAARRHLGYLPEQFAAPPEMRTGEYLRYRACLKGLPRRQARQRVADVAEPLGLMDRLRQPFSALSQGFRQRVGLADALLADPPALLLDEPFRGLDPIQRREFRQRLRDLADEGRAILFSSHVLPEVEAVADRVLVLHRGQTLAEGSCAELLARAQAQTPFRLRWLGDSNLKADLAVAFPQLQVEQADDQSLTFRWHGPKTPADFFSWLALRPEEIMEYRRLDPDLEDLFQTLVEEAEA